MAESGYLPLFDAICFALDIYEPGDSDAKFKGLLSRVTRSIKNGEIDFSYNEKGKRYIHVKKLKKWAGHYISEFSLIEGEEEKKLENLKKENNKNMQRIEVENTSDLIIKAEKHINDVEAKKRGADKTNQKKKESKTHCIKIASDLWGMKYDDDSDVYKLKEMSQLLLEDLSNYPELFQPKSINTLRIWLKEAEKNGELIIPEAAKKPGRPKKSN